MISPVKKRTHDQDDYQFLMDNARSIRAQGLDHLLHLDQPVGIWNYIRMANEIADAVSPGRMLDWGCGLGQMSFLMRRRGFDVTAYELGSTIDNDLPDMPLTRVLNVIRADHPTRLPFEGSSFDAVLSCGVLEHVDEFSEPGNEKRSLEEIRRVLRPGGHFFIYQLPQRYTWQEAIIRRLGRYTHPRLFVAPEIRAMLDEKGFRVLSVRRNNMLPKSLTGMPRALRDFYSLFARPILAVDRVISRVPGLNQVAGVLEVVARREA
jgi:SAM-dependent methyltransferase